MSRKKQKRTGDRPGEKLQRLVTILEGVLSGDAHTAIESPAYLIDRKTGERREHDVLLIRQTSIRTVVTAIECKDHSRPVGVTLVEAFHTKCDDTGVDKGVMVSSRGFGGPARRKAEIYNIDCLSLEETTHHSWTFDYSLRGVKRKILSCGVAALSDEHIEGPSHLFEKQPNGEVKEISERDSSWIVDRFRDLHERNLIPSTAEIGINLYEATVALQPVEKFVIMDDAGNEHRVVSVDLTFQFEETGSIVPMETHAYGDASTDERVQLSSAIVPGFDSGLDISIAIVDTADGRVKVIHSQLERP